MTRHLSSFTLCSVGWDHQVREPLVRWPTYGLRREAGGFIEFMLLIPALKA